LSFTALLDGRVSRGGYRADGLLEPREGDLLPFFERQFTAKRLQSSKTPRGATTIFARSDKAMRIHKTLAAQSTGTVLSSCPSGRGGGMADATDL